MRIFATQIMDEIRPNKYIFHKLLINGKCLLDQYEIEIASNPIYFRSYQSIGQYMQRYVDGLMLLQKQWREIKHPRLRKLNVKCFEF